MARLRRVEDLGDRAEDDHDAGAQQAEGQDQDHRENGQDEGVFDQRLPFFARAVPNPRARKEIEDGSHCGR